MVTSGILLAGGQSTRFGSPKAFALNQGEYYYERSYNILAEICDHVVIVTLAELQPRFPKHLHVITDCELFKGKGPLAGLYSAMMSVEAERYVVLPCDMPYLSSDGLRQMLNEASDNKVYALKLNDHYHPLVSCWPRNILPNIENALKKEQLSVMTLLQQINEQTVWLDGATLFDDACYRLQNINRPMKEVKK